MIERTDLQSNRTGITAGQTLVLSILSVAPVYGGLSVVLLLLGSLIFVCLNLKRLGRLPGSRTLAAIFTLYFCYFLIQGGLVTGNAIETFKTMRGNLPILFAGLLALSLSGDTVLHPKTLGRWATVATLATAAFAAGLYVVYNVFDLAGIALIEKTDLTSRLRLYSRNALIFAAMLMTLAFVALAGFSEKTRAERRLSILAVIVAVLIVSIWSLSRGATLTSVGLGLIAIWYTRPKVTTVLSICVAIALLVTALYLAYAPFADVIERMLSRLTVVASSIVAGDPGTDSSLSQRLTMYTLGVEAFFDAPWRGYGFQNRFEAIVPYQSSDITFHHEHLHNAFLSHTVAGGVAGLVILLAFIFAPLVIRRRLGSKNRDVTYLTAVLITAMIGIGMSTSLLGHHLQTTFFSTLMVAQLLLIRAEQPHPRLKTCP